MSDNIITGPFGDYVPIAEYEHQKEGSPPLVAAQAELEPIRASNFAGQPVPPREWLARDVPKGKVTLLTGDGGTGKSLLALQLCCAVATGTRWFRSDVIAGPACYLSCEDDRDELHRRALDIATENGWGLSDLTDLLLLDMSGEDAVLAGEGQRGGLVATALMGRLRATVERFKPALLVVDNLADVFAGNENARSLAKAFIKALEATCRPHGTTCIVIAHPSLSGIASGAGTSGSTGWNNAVRSRLYLEREGEAERRRGDETDADPDVRVLRTMKANYGATGRELRLRWHAGTFVEADASAGGAPAQSLASVKAERVFMDLLARFEGQDRNVSANKGPTYAPALFASHSKRDGVTGRQFASAMEALLDDGRIESESIGPPSRRRSRLRIAPEAESKEV